MDGQEQLPNPTMDGLDPCPSDSQYVCHSSPYVLYYFILYDKICSPILRVAYGNNGFR